MLGIANAEILARATADLNIRSGPGPHYPVEVRTYVETNTVEPVYLDGEIVVGAALPETVEVREIPDYDYRYVYVNEQPVLVEPNTRRIVYVLR